MHVKIPKRFAFEAWEYTFRTPQPLVDNLGNPHKSLDPQPWGRLGVYRSGTYVHQPLVCLTHHTHLGIVLMRVHFVQFRSIHSEASKGTHSNTRLCVRGGTLRTAAPLPCPHSRAVERRK